MSLKYSITVTQPDW